MHAGKATGSSPHAVIVTVADSCNHLPLDNELIAEAFQPRRRQLAASPAF
jgi:hypothetical protein